MVCDRCKYVIQNILDDMNIKPSLILIGEVDLGRHKLNEKQLILFRDKIERLGFEIISDKKSLLIERIKKHILSYSLRNESEEKAKLSEYLSERLHHDYSYISNLFSSMEGVTIEQHLINKKIEKVKELLVYDELSLTEISYQLNYSSVAHLSRQFKKVIGMTPSKFKLQCDNSQRKSLDKA